MNENSGTPATEQLVHFDISTFAPIPPRDLPARNLPETDGMPMDSPWHRLAMTLLLETVWYFFRDRTDFYAGGNMFLYSK